MESLLIITAVFPPEPVVSAKLSFDIASEICGRYGVIVISPRPTRPLGFKFNTIVTDYSFSHIQLNSYTCPQSSITGRFIESYSFGRYCFRYISENRDKIKLIYANTWPLISQYFIVKAAKKFNIPVIIHVQDVYPESLLNKFPFGKPLFEMILLPIDKFILRNADKIIAISENMKSYLVKTRGVDSNSFCVVQNWQDEEEFIRHNISDNSNEGKGQLFTFMFLGNIGPVAGVDLLLHSFVKAKLNNCRIVIAGSGSMRESLEKKYKKTNNSSIEFWSVPDGKVPEIQSYADVMLLPINRGASLSSIPSKLPAYMLSSKPIIACVDEEGDIADTIIQAKCGWIVLPQNVDLLINMMTKAISMPKEDLKTMGRNGFNYALEKLSKKKNLQKVITIINEFIGK